MYTNARTVNDTIRSTAKLKHIAKAITTIAMPQDTLSIHKKRVFANRLASISLEKLFSYRIGLQKVNIPSILYATIKH